ncbi:hypothetical protein HMPREF3039_02762 [Akkermansia sp. KLE1798]|nr:hypothetical protein HMPREF3039_02762 [Akkermansia sp. KLE1798]KZA03642.1 hypothetical protein HMPREF1326_02619 [Akkermansia sp. KLE1605]
MQKLNVCSSHFGNVPFNLPKTSLIGRKISVFPKGGSFLPLP